MHISLIIVVVVSIAAVIAAAGVMFSILMREKKKSEREDAVAKAAQEYLSRFEIRARIVASTLPNDRIVLMVETPPHKKLRFSYIIEQPIKQFVFKQTEIEVDRMFWRFPMQAKNTQTQNVQYGGPTTILQSASASSPEAAAHGEPAPPTENHDIEDEYFHGQSYQIEEVRWEDFSTISKPKG